MTTPNPHRTLARWARSANPNRGRGDAARIAAVRTDGAVYLVSNYVIRVVTPADGTLWAAADMAATLAAEARANGPALFRKVAGVPWLDIYGADGAEIYPDHASAMTLDMVNHASPTGGWRVQSREDVRATEPSPGGAWPDRMLLLTGGRRRGPDATPVAAVVNPALLDTLGACDFLRVTGPRRAVTAWVTGADGAETLAGVVMPLNVSPDAVAPVVAVAS